MYSWLWTSAEEPKEIHHRDTEGEGQRREKKSSPQRHGGRRAGSVIVEHKAFDPILQENNVEVD